MNKHATWLLLVPMVAWGNELPQPKIEAKPAKAVESHAAPDAKSAKPIEPSAAKESAAKPASKHAAPQQMTEPIKIAKPSTAQAPAPAPAAEAHSTAPEVLKPTGQAVSRYVSPQFSTAKAEAHRPVVRSKAPTASSRSHSTKSTTSYAMKPGMVRVLPASQIPSSAILPPSKQIQWSAPSNTPNAKAKVAWGVMEPEALKTAPEITQPSAGIVAAPVAGRKIASPKYYSETNPEQRWQYYSYP